MASADVIAFLEADVDASLGEVASVGAKLSEKKAKIGELKESVAAEVAAAYKEGKESIVLPSPNDPAVQFTQADMDKLAEVAKAEGAAAKEAEMQPKIDELGAKVAELEGRVDVTPFAQADIDLAVEAARAEMRVVIADLETKLSQKDADAIEEAVAGKLRSLADELSARSAAPDPVPAV